MSLKKNMIGSLNLLRRLVSLLTEDRYENGVVWRFLPTERESNTNADPVNRNPAKCAMRTECTGQQESDE